MAAYFAASKLGKISAFIDPLSKSPELFFGLSNDDGIYSSGIYALWDVAREFGDVTLVAPNMQKSAVGHGITIANPLYVREIDRGNGFKGSAVSGTPADCVKIGIKKIMKSIPDMVLSGINIGSNLTLIL